MDLHERVLFCDIMATLGEAFQREITDALLQIYWVNLRDLSIEQLQSAAMMAIQTETFFPKVAMLRDVAGVPTRQPRSQAEVAWVKLRRLSGPKAYERTALDDPVTHLVFRDMGGSLYFGTWDYAQEDWRKREFLERYSDFEARLGTLSQEEASRLLGQFGLEPKGM